MPFWAHSLELLNRLSQQRHLASWRLGAYILLLVAALDGSRHLRRVSSTSVAADEIDLRILRAGIASIWLLTGALVLHPEYRRIGLERLAPLGLPAWVMFA